MATRMRPPTLRVEMENLWDPNTQIYYIHLQTPDMKIILHPFHRNYISGH